MSGRNTKRLIRVAACALLSVTACAAASAEPDLAAGKALHDTECLVCHPSSHYSRAERRVDSLQRLEKQVDTCQQDVGADWDAQQSGAVVRYLNRSFYHF
ncbi:MAG: hypothetical protein J5I92_04160 [Thiogranum sp.]|nr:hypothetical protein [Thiogranum sp.]